MKTLIFLDDERNFEDVTWIKYPEYNVKIVRNMKEFINEVLLNSDNMCNTDYSFDHDIMDFVDDKENTGYTCVQWLCDYIIDNYIDNIDMIMNSITIYVHSKNPIGKMNIETYYENFKIFFSSCSNDDRKR